MRSTTVSFYTLKPTLELGFARELHPDFQERANEVIAALNFLKSRNDIRSDLMGLYGTSQAARAV